MTSKGLVVLSGGLDSTTLLHLAMQECDEVAAISFDYGQRHRKELQYAAYTVAKRGLDWQIADISFLKDLFAESGSSLVTDEAVPEGHYAEDNMKATVVPNRNMIMLSIAAGYGISIMADYVYTGVHAGDHFIYPDCRPDFIRPCNAAIARGNAGFGPIHEYNADPAVGPQEFIKTPFIDKSKNDIANLAFALGVDIAHTWSCYKGGDIHCGKCGTCVERREAIESTGYGDPTVYEDRDFWKSVVQ